MSYVDTTRSVRYSWRDGRVFRAEGDAEPVLCSQTMFPAVEGTPRYIYPLAGSDDDDLFIRSVVGGEWDTIHHIVDYLGRIGESSRRSNVVQLASQHTVDPFAVLLQMCGRSAALASSMHERVLRRVPALVETHDPQELLTSSLFVARCLPGYDTSLLLRVLGALFYDGSGPSAGAALARFLVVRQPSMPILGDLVARGAIDAAELSRAILAEIPPAALQTHPANRYAWIRRACTRLATDHFERYVIQAARHGSLHPTLAGWCSRYEPTLLDVLRVLAGIVETCGSGVQCIEGLRASGIPLAVPGSTVVRVPTWGSLVHHVAVSADDNDRCMAALVHLLEHDSSCVHSRVDLDGTPLDLSGTPLDLAAYHNQPQTIDLLLRQGAIVDVSLRGSIGYALARGYTNIVQKLVEHVVHVEGDARSVHSTTMFRRLWRRAIYRYNASDALIQWIVQFMVDHESHKPVEMVTVAARNKHAFALRLLVLYGWDTGGPEAGGPMKSVIAAAEDEVLRRLVDQHIHAADTAALVAQYARRR